MRWQNWLALRAKTVALKVSTAISSALSQCSLAHGWQGPVHRLQAHTFMAGALDSEHDRLAEGSCSTGLPAESDAQDTGRAQSQWYTYRPLGSLFAAPQQSADPEVFQPKRQLRRRRKGVLEPHLILIV